MSDTSIKLGLEEPNGEAVHMLNTLFYATVLIMLTLTLTFTVFDKPVCDQMVSNMKDVVLYRILMQNPDKSHPAAHPSPLRSSVKKVSEIEKAIRVGLEEPAIVPPWVKAEKELDKYNLTSSLNPS